MKKIIYKCIQAVQTHVVQGSTAFVKRNFKHSQNRWLRNIYILEIKYFKVIWQKSLIHGHTKTWAEEREHPDALNVCGRFYYLATQSIKYW